LDEQRIVCRIVQRIPKPFHNRVQHPVDVDGRFSAPETLMQVLASHERACMLDQDDQHLQRLILQTDSHAVALKLAAQGIELERAETESVWLRWRHAV
jgi:hypothetical protein